MRETLALTEDQISEALRRFPDRQRYGNQIPRSVEVRYHAGVALTVHVAGAIHLHKHAGRGRPRARSMSRRCSGAWFGR